MTTNTFGQTLSLALNYESKVKPQGWWMSAI